MKNLSEVVTMCMFPSDSGPNQCPTNRNNAQYYHRLGLSCVWVNRSLRIYRHVQTELLNASEVTKELT